MDRLSQLKDRFSEIRDRIGADWPVRTSPMQDGFPHVEVDGNLYAYVVTERGSELERRTTDSEDELLYWLASDMVFSLAGYYEFHHRQPGSDSRRLMFAREIDLMGRIKPAWKDRKQAEIYLILEQHPYQDANEA